MAGLLYVVGTFAALFGAGVFANEQSAIHEIEGLIAGLVFVCAFGFAKLIELMAKVEECGRPPQPPRAEARPGS